MQELISYDNNMTLIERFYTHCKESLNDKVYIWEEREECIDELKGNCLEHQVSGLGNILSRNGSPQNRVLIALPNRLDSVIGFWACLHANLVAVLISNEDLEDPDLIEERVGALYEDTQAKIILCDNQSVEFFTNTYKFLECVVINVQEYREMCMKEPCRMVSHPTERKRDDLALIVYTSGSTSGPKGTLHTHRSLWEGTAVVSKFWRVDRQSCFVSWLPNSHVLGIQVNLLVPIMCGGKVVCMPPNHFLRSPKAWLKLISKYQGTLTAAPNFAYDYCTSFIDIEEDDQINLSSLEAAVCAGEVVRKETVDNFCNKFEKSGFERNAFTPHYGTSEAQAVSVKCPGEELRFIALDIDSLENGIILLKDHYLSAKSVTSCGELIGEVDIRIVDLDSHSLSQPNMIGEVWVKYGGLSPSYYQRDSESKQAFNNVITDTGEKGFYRTGDTGFIYQNELYILGRVKDLIIINGKNYNPMDIERTIRKGIKSIDLPTVVFGCDIDNKESAIVVQELNKPLSLNEYKDLCSKMMSLVSKQYGIKLADVVFIKEGGVPRTGVGKIRKNECLKAYMSQKLPVFYSFKKMNTKEVDITDTGSKITDKLLHEKLYEEILSKIFHTFSNQISKSTLFSELGMDSIARMQLVEAIETNFKITTSPAILFKYNTIGELEQYIAAEISLKEESKEGHYQEDVNSNEEDIAVIGMHGIFPGSEDLDEYWCNLINGIDCISNLNDKRNEITKMYERIFNQPIEFPNYGGFIENVKSFDAAFFGISPREAECMDPQQRKVLELTWSVIENSGYAPTQLKGMNIGVYVGAHHNDYAELVAENPALLNNDAAYFETGLHISMIANRVSRWFDFHGPSEVINTACSSSLVAVHHAVESLRKGESSMAIAGGINLILSPNTYCGTSKSGMLAKDGRCKAFDEKADGYVRSEGCGAVILKPLAAALADNDTVYGVIKAAVINHDGQSHSLRAPNPNSQKSLLKSAYKNYSNSSHVVDYIEMHGTGTPIGDPVEVQALTEAFNEINPEMPSKSCGLGSVKTNIGHCESAAGIAGMIKILLSIKHNRIPGILHYNKANPYIALNESSFYIVRDNMEWKRKSDEDNHQIPRRAGVSSFGFGGVNAHVVIEEYMSNDIAGINSKSEEPMPILFSAKTRKSLIWTCEKFVNFLEKEPVDLRNMAYTLYTSREFMNHRVAFLVNSIEELTVLLRKYVNGTLEEDSFPKSLYSWVKGEDVEFSVFDKDMDTRRIALPTYSFDKDIFWIPEVNPAKQLADFTKSIKWRYDEMNGWSLEQCLIWDLKKIMSDLLRVSDDKIENTGILKDYGFDSISFVELAGILSEKYTIVVHPDIFFSYSSVTDVGKYLLNNFKDTILEYYFIEERDNKIDAIIQEEEPGIISSPKNEEIITQSIAIIGMSGRFPKARSINELWHILSEGREVLQPLPTRRSGWNTVTLKSSMGVMPGIEEFDPLFFEISPREAEKMDPRQRLLLEEAWKALEDAGIGKELINNSKVGMFVGAEDGDYQFYLDGEGFTYTHNAILAARLSHNLNLHGPNMAINTACSSGLVALHEACLSLWSGECDTAIVASANLLTTSGTYNDMKAAGMISSSGRCYAFDKRADGMVPGEAVAVIVLKKESDAIADRHSIYANIIGTGINYDGKTNGITAPNGQAQQMLLNEVYSKFNINPDKIGYIVAHGTGTRLGDPIEINALTNVFKNNESGFCALTSTKPNLGHSQAASGLVSLISLILSMNKKEIPPHINCEQVSDYIDWENSPFYINKELRIWDEDAGGRMGAVNSFGFSGTNAHVIIKEARVENNKTNKESRDDSCYILSFSGRTLNSLEKNVNNFIDYLETQPESMKAISYTLQNGRHHFQNRLAIIAHSKDDAITLLKKALIEEKNPNIFKGKVERDFKEREVIKQSINEYIKYGYESKDNPMKYYDVLCTLAEYYCSGYSLNLRKLWNVEEIKLAHLPSYSFDNGTYWIHKEEVSNLGNDTFFFSEAWEEETNHHKCSENQSENNIVVFLSDERTKEELIKYFEKHYPNANLIFVYNGDSFRECDLVAFLDKVTCQYKRIDTIFYLNPIANTSLWEDARGIFFLMKSVIQAQLDAVNILAAGFFENDIQRCHLESWVGIERTTGIILPHCSVKIVGIEKTEDHMEQWIDILCNEWRNAGSKSAIYKSGKRFTSHIREISIEEKPGTLLKHEGVYMVTGGLGGIGYIISRFLLTEYDANLILINRSSLNKYQDRYNELLKISPNIIYIQADICNLEQMEKGMQEIKKIYNRIDGVIHAAGLEGSKSIMEETLEEYQDILQPKIQGTIILDEVLKDYDPDFICYFSSTAAILGDFGNCAYSVGNRFLMAYADNDFNDSKVSNISIKKLVINWPLWNSTGMGSDDKERCLMYLGSSGQQYLEAEEGGQIFHSLIGQKRAQHIVMKGNHANVCRILKINHSEEKDSIAIKNEAEESLIEVNTKAGINGTIEKCLDWDLKRMISSFLKLEMENIERENNLIEYGFDSISLANFSSILGEYYQLRITPDMFFNNPTLERLENYLLTHYSDDFSRFFDSQLSNSVKKVKQRESTVHNRQSAIKRESKLDMKHRSGIEQSEIAIIGMSGRFPDSNTVDDLWEIFKNGKEVIEAIPMERTGWIRNAGRERCRIGAISNIDKFDPLFFEISPKEAEEMDPRQRILLEECWNALENACYGVETLKTESVGVFVGAEEGDYESLSGDNTLITSNSNACLSARIAYFLNFMGPNFTINSACSSGLVALHEACQSLLNNECDAAIVAGASVLSTSLAYDAMEKAGMISHDGHCYTFDNRAKGMIPAEAVGVLILKKLHNAEKEKKPIFARIIGSGINYDGKTSGITAPNGNSQASLLNNIYKKFNINPKEIGYYIAHGTGTKLGDPIEINALSALLKNYNLEPGSCALTSTKPNIGHSLAASGIVSVICMVQSLLNEQIPPSINCEDLNEYIAWKNSPLYVNRELKSWSGENRKGAVSAFGMSGTNAHVVLQNYNLSNSHDVVDRRGCNLFVFSAKSEGSLNNILLKFLQMVESDKKIGAKELDSISYTLLRGRHHFIYRYAFVAEDRDEFVKLLKQSIEGTNTPEVFHGIVSKKFKRNVVLVESMNYLIKQCKNHNTDIQRDRSLLDALADLYCSGYDINTDELWDDAPDWYKLPNYSFEDGKYWIKNKNIRRSPLIIAKLSKAELGSNELEF